MTSTGVGDLARADAATAWRPSADELDAISALFAPAGA
ncbi:hypothetical protein ABIE24_002702 [Mycetocola sp. 2940]